MKRPPKRPERDAGRGQNGKPGRNSACTARVGIAFDPTYTMWLTGNVMAEDVSAGKWLLPKRKLRPKAVSSLREESSYMACSEREPVSFGRGFAALVPGLPAPA